MTVDRVQQADVGPSRQWIFVHPKPAGSVSLVAETRVVELPRIRKVGTELAHKLEDAGITSIPCDGYGSLQRRVGNEGPGATKRRRIGLGEEGSTSSGGWSYISSARDFQKRQLLSVPGYRSGVVWKYCGTPEVLVDVAVACLGSR